MRCVTVNACGAHEIHRILNALGKAAVFFHLLAVGKAQRPGVHLVHIGKTTGGECAQKVQRRGRLGVGAQHVVGVRNARLWRKVQPVDDVTAVARQLDAIHNLGWGAARFGELTRHAAHFDHWHFGAIGQHHRHLQHHAKGVADTIRAELLKALGAIAPLKQESLATAGSRQVRL